MGELKPTTTSILEPGQQSGFATTKFESLLAWAQKYSLFMNPFVTACCGMEFMAVSSPRYDLGQDFTRRPGQHMVGVGRQRRGDRIDLDQQRAGPLGQEWQACGGMHQARRAD